MSSGAPSQMSSENSTGINLSDRGWYIGRMRGTIGWVTADDVDVDADADDEVDGGI